MLAFESALQHCPLRLKSSSVLVLEDNLIPMPVLLPANYRNMRAVTHFALHCSAKLAQTSSLLLLPATNVPSGWVNCKDQVMGEGAWKGMEMDVRHQMGVLWTGHDPKTRGWSQTPAPWSEGGCGAWERRKEGNRSTKLDQHEADSWDWAAGAIEVVSRSAKERDASLFFPRPA